MLNVITFSCTGARPDDDGAAAPDGVAGELPLHAEFSSIASTAAAELVIFTLVKSAANKLPC